MTVIAAEPSEGTRRPSRLRVSDPAAKVAVRSKEDQPRWLRRDANTGR